jgi:hypothetical protein
MLAQKKLATNYTNCTNAFRWVLFVFVLFIASCSTQPTDVRTVIPGDALIYLETQDLGKALTAITDNDAFRAAAKSQPDFSALNGIKVGVAVTGFESKDVPATDGASELNIQPRFVAIAETNAWNYQAIKFAENKLGEFVNEIYGGGVELERFPRYDGDYFIWTADDGRKAYGLVIGSLIFFGNDETAIEKCVAVRKSEAEAIAKSGKLPSGEYLASGYVGPDGVAQIANIGSIQLAVGAGEEEVVRGFIARVLPEIVRNSVKEATWTARKSEQGIEDAYTFTMDPEIAKVLTQSIKPGSAEGVAGIDHLPADVVSASVYNLANPQVAWRSVLLTAQQRAGGTAGELIGAVGDSLFEPYGIDNAEAFLGSVDGKLISVRFDPEGEDVVVIATPKDLAKVKASLAKEFKLAGAGERIGSGEVWRSDEGELAFAVVGQRVLLGHAESVIKCLNGNAPPSPMVDALKAAGAVPAFSYTSDVDPAAALVSALGQSGEEKKPLIQSYRISTSFDSKGILRTETSSFGLIGSVIEQFAKE